MDKTEQMTDDLREIVRILETHSNDSDIMEILEAAMFELQIDRDVFVEYLTSVFE